MPRARPKRHVPRPWMTQPASIGYATSWLRPSIGPANEKIACGRSVENSAYTSTPIAGFTSEATAPPTAIP